MTGKRGVDRVFLKASLLLMVSLPACAQSLVILPSPPSGDQTATFQIMLVTDIMVPVSALQWQISVFNGSIANVDQVQLGNAAQNVQKSLACAVSNTVKIVRALNCLVYGGMQPLADGAIAQVEVGTPARKPLIISIHHILGANPVGEPVHFPDFQVQIR